MKYLETHGYEIGAHGHLHQRFDKLSKEKIQKDIDLFNECMRKVGVDPEKIVSFAWPHGLSPKKSVRLPIDKEFKYVADFGFHCGKEKQNQVDPHRIKRLFIGPHTGFSQYAP